MAGDEREQKSTSTGVRRNQSETSKLCRVVSDCVQIGIVFLVHSSSRRHCRSCQEVTFHTELKSDVGSSLLHSSVRGVSTLVALTWLVVVWEKG